MTKFQTHGDNTELIDGFVKFIYKCSHLIIMQYLKLNIMTPVPWTRNQILIKDLIGML